MGWRCGAVCEAARRPSKPAGRSCRARRATRRAPQACALRPRTRSPVRPLDAPAPSTHLLGGLDVQHVQDDGLVGAQHRAARNHGADGVADLAGRAGDQDALGGLGHGACGAVSQGARRGGGDRQGARPAAVAAAAAEGDVWRGADPACWRRSTPHDPQSMRWRLAARVGAAWGLASPAGHQPCSGRSAGWLASRSPLAACSRRAQAAPECRDRAGKTCELCNRQRSSPSGLQGGLQGRGRRPEMPQWPPESQPSRLAAPRQRRWADPRTCVRAAVARARAGLLGPCR